MPMRHLSLAIPLLLVLSACSEGRPPPQAAAPALPATFTVAAAAGAGGVEWDGVVQAVEQATLSAQTAGRVVALGADIDQRVAAGAVLLRLTAEEQSAAVRTAEAQLRAAEARLVDAASRHRRATELVARQLVSREEAEGAAATHDAAQAARDAAAAQLAEARQQLDYTTVRAPFAGVVAARSIEVGETVAPGRVLFTLYAPGQLRVEVDIPQSDAAAVRAGPAATVTLADGRQFEVRKVTVYPAADPQAHSTRVRVQLPAVETPPRPGQTARVRFAAAAGPEGIWIPASAVVQRGELAGVYVVSDSGVLLRQLRLGRSAGAQIEVLAGLARGEQVASDPVAALQWLRTRQGGASAP